MTLIIKLFTALFKTKSVDPGKCYKDILKFLENESQLKWSTDGNNIANGLILPNTILL